MTIGRFFIGRKYLAYGGASLFLVILVVLFTSFSSIGITHTVSYAMAVLDGALGTKGSSQERFLDASNSPLPVTPQPASHVKYPPVDEAHEETKGGQISMERATSEDVNTATPIKSSDGQQHPAAVPCIKDTKIQVTELGDSMDWKQGVGNNSLEEQLHSLKNQLKIAEKENQDLHANIAREVIKRREAETEELEWKLEKKVRNELLLQLQKDPDALNKPQDALPEEVPMNYEPSPVNEAKSVPSSIESRVYWPKPPHSQRSSNMFLVPQHVCPGKPSTAGLIKGAPKASEADFIQKHLDMIADGMVYTEATGDQPEDIQNASCVFITKPCAETTANQQGRWVMNKLKSWVKTEEELAAVAALFPNVGERGLGSCAIVGNSDNMMSAERGAEIDAHDTIFRHNTPLKGYEKRVGSRRSVVYMKSKYQDRAGQMGDVELALAELKDISAMPQNMRSNGKMVFLRSGAANHFARLRRKLYMTLGYTGSKHPSGGWARPINLLASKLCTRIDLYGFSANMGGKYFKPSERVRPAHVMSFEHWTYRYMMSKGKLCVYGD